MDSNLLTDGLLEKGLEEQCSEMMPYLRLSSEDEQKKNLIMLNKKVLKALYSPYATNDSLNATDTIGMLLLHFRLMTAEQAQMLLPGYSENPLQEKNKKRLKSNIVDSVPITEGGKLKCYFLNPAGFDRYRNGKFGPSEEYLEAARIPKYYSDTGIGSTQLLHNVNLRDVPYKCLSIPEYAQFDWYTGIELVTGYTPKDSVLREIETDRGRSQENAFQGNRKGSLIADAVMLFRTSSFLVEEDRGTENVEKLKDKLASYERYLDGQTEPQNIRLLIPVDCYKEDGRSYIGGAGTRTLRNIKNYIKEHGDKNLDALYKELAAMEFGKKEPEDTASDSIGIRMRNAMLKFLKEYFATLDGETPAETKSVKDLEEYATHKAAAKKESLANFREQKNSRRQQAILSMLREAHTPKSTWEKLIISGVSITVTSTFKEHAYYLTPYESGYLRQLARKIEEDLGIKKKAVISSSFTLNLGNGTQLVLKNCITVPRDINRPQQYYFVFEISCNYADLCRAKKLLEVLDKIETDTQFHVLLLTKDSMESVRFMKKTNYVDRYCNELKITFPKKNVYIRFYCYGDQHMTKYFVTDKSGLIQTVRSL